ncbi:MAG TPA: tyrosine-type recombinase/integrase [Acetobacteraceae bacterium]|jgi:integrase|nr:tyrosine-type recombinase/integrase [Acetobacteraceae bacterium]
MPSYLQKRRRRWYAVVEIPTPLRPHFRGKPRFVQTLETDSLATAQRRALPIVAAWQRQIAEARGDPPADDAAFFRRALRNASTDADRANIMQQVSDHADALGALAVPLGSLPSAATEATAFYTSATGTPFGDHLGDWQKASRVTAKTKDMQKADVARFAAEFPTVAAVDKPGVKRWVGKLMADGLAPKTVQRVLSALRGYWRHLQAIGAAPDAFEPFTGLDVARQGGRVTRDDKRRPFTPADVVALLAKARERSDHELADLIDLGRWTGARIEELCILRVENVNLAATIPYLTITAGKTDAAIRGVPIHAQLAPTLAKLIGDRTTGWVLAKLTENKYGDRSNAIGKRFGRLRTDAGYGPQLVYHSIRKCVATLFKDASVPEATAADILGHDIVTMSYGVYAGDVSLATKAEAIAKLAYPAAA